MATIQTYLGLPDWTYERYPDQWDLFVKTASKGLELFEEPMEAAMREAGGPDAVESSYVGEVAREAFNTAFAAVNDVGLTDGEWEDLEASFCHQMENHFDTTMSFSWRPEEAAGPSF